MTAHPAEPNNVARLADRSEIKSFVDALFRYAREDTFVVLRSFYHDDKRPPADTRNHRIQSTETLITAAAQRATYVANLPDPTVFAPPICTFVTSKSAEASNLAEGLVISVECDAKPEAARQVLEGLLGKATVAMKSGGEWVDPETGEVHDRLHLHWRLSEPTTEPEDHQKLKRARGLAALIAESDVSAVPMVHPLRWPGSWHLKATPKLATIADYSPDIEVHLEEALSVLEDAAQMRGAPLDDLLPRTNGNAALAEDEDLTALVEAIPNDADTPWDRYNAVGMAFWGATQGSEAGRAAFIAWAAKSPKAHGGADARWGHYRTSPPNRLTLGKLVWFARKADPTFRLPKWDRVKAALKPEGEARDWEAPLLAAVEELNEKHFVVQASGQTVIASPEYDNTLRREFLVFSREADIKLRYRYRHLHVGYTQKGVPIMDSLGNAWLSHRNRRNYNRLALIPKGDVPPDVYNLWRGFGVDPKPGDWSLIRHHLLDVICSGNERDYGWLIGWLARAVQYPELHAEVAVVLRGRKGTGKGSLGQIMTRLFRHHALQISNPTHFTGRFNGHLVDVLFLFVDEAFWAGDKAGEGTLKGLVTESTIPIEPKYVNLFVVPNRLKILMASNADWVVPATADERRYFVLDVSECHRGDYDYFTRLHSAINGDELAAFLYYLLSLNISTFDFRNAPHTGALNQQKLRGADSFTSFWFDCLRAGAIVDTDNTSWPTVIVTQNFHAAYIEYAHNHGDRHPLSDAMMAKKFATMMPNGRLRTYRPQIQGTRPPGYILQSLAECRRAFLAAMNIDSHSWVDGDEA